MQITDIIMETSTIYTVELEENVFVDVKHIGNCVYVMQCEDGYEAYDSNGNSFEYHFDEEAVIEFVKNTICE